MAQLVLLNNFLHDFSAAMWLAATLVLWLVLRDCRSSTDLDVRSVAIVKAMLRWMGLSLVGIVILGGIRALAYRAYEWNAAAGDSQITLLLVKHAAFTVFFIPGVVMIARARKLLRGMAS